MEVCLENKTFVTDMYKNIQRFAFKMLQEYSSWASRNGAVQMFFLTPSRYMFAGIFVRFFEWNCIVKWVTFFASFCWLWDFLLENLKFKKKNSDNVHWNMWTSIKKLYVWNSIFKKRMSDMRFWIIYILVQISFVWWIPSGCFSQCFAS